MRASEFVFEIGYSAAVCPMSTSESDIVLNSTMVGDIDGRDVYLFSTNLEEMYFYLDNTKKTIDAFVTIEKQKTNGYRHLRGIQNITGKPGCVTALVGFLVHMQKLKLKIASNEELTPGGYRWLKSFILRKPRGITITDQNGQFPDIVELDTEWNKFHTAFGHGPMEIVLESDNRLVFNTKKENQLLMMNTYYIGDTKIL